MTWLIGWAALLGLQAGATPSDALAPSGKWVADFGVKRCTLSRSFGAGADAVRLTISVTPGSSIADLLLERRRGKGNARREGDAAITIEPTGASVTQPFREAPSADGEQRVASTHFWRSKLDLAQAQVIAIRLAKDSPVRVRLDTIAAATRTLDNCEEQALRDWGFDPAALRQMTESVSPDGNPAEWLRRDDYPAEAVSNRWTGVVAMRLRIGLDGKPENCAVVESSGHDVLDRQSCAVMMLRARFHPAHDKDGKPIVAPWQSNFTWMLP